MNVPCINARCYRSHALSAHTGVAKKSSKVLLKQCVPKLLGVVIDGLLLRLEFAILGFKHYALLPAGKKLMGMSSTLMRERSFRIAMRCI